ncbi:MAG: hypothetical protein ABJN69_09720 [Hellea sp.]
MNLHLWNLQGAYTLPRMTPPWLTLMRDFFGRKVWPWGQPPLAASLVGSYIK